MQSNFLQKKQSMAKRKDFERNGQEETNRTRLLEEEEKEEDEEGS